MAFAKTVQLTTQYDEKTPPRAFVVHEDLAEEIGITGYGPKSDGSIELPFKPEAVEVYLNWVYDKNLDIAEYAFVEPKATHLDRHFGLPHLQEQMARARLLVGRIAGLLDLWDVGYEFSNFDFTNKIMDLLCGEKLEQEQEKLLHLLVDVLNASTDEYFWNPHSYESACIPTCWLIDVLAGSLSAEGLTAMIRSKKVEDTGLTKALTKKMVEARDRKPIDSRDYHI